MNETLFVEDRDILMMKLSARRVDTEALLDVTPKDIAEALLIRRKALKEQLPNIIRQNELWLKERKSSNPQMAEFIEKRKKMNSLYKAADKEHREMIKNVNLGEPVHAKYMARKTELLDIERQRDRARQLLKNLDRDISYWENTILDGFDGLMALAMKVQQGGMSSFSSNKNKKVKNDINSKKMEEEE